MVGFLQTSAKAVAAFVVGALLAYFVKKGLVVSTDTQTYLTSGLEGLIVAVVVWLVPNKK